MRAIILALLGGCAFAQTAPTQLARMSARGVTCTVTATTADNGADCTCVRDSTNLPVSRATLYVTELTASTSANLTAVTPGATPAAPPDHVTFTVHVSRTAGTVLGSSALTVTMSASATVQ